MTESKVLFEDSEIKALFFPAEGDTLCITFSPYTNAFDIPQPFGIPFLLNYGVSVLAFVATHNHWYQLPNFDGIISRIKNTISLQSYKHICCYGSSMGGYAANVFAKYFGASRVIAISPQRSIWKEHNGSFETRFPTEALRYKTIYGDSINHIDMSCEYYIVYDSTHKLDVLQIEPYMGLSNCCLLKAPFSGHPSGHVLSFEGVLKRLVISILNPSNTAEEILKNYSLDRRAHRADNLGYLKRLAYLLRVTRSGNKDIIDEITSRFCEPSSYTVEHIKNIKADYHFNCSHSFYQEGKIEYAIEHVLAAVTIDPNKENYYRHLENLKKIPKRLYA